jgi:hypothetical protein
MSPIEGLSDVRRLPRLGKIRMGIKVVSQTSGKEYPQKTDYFVCPPEVQKVYGEKPKSLDIIIPVEDDEKWCAQWYKLYSQTQGCVCHGDGGGEASDRCFRKFDTATGCIAHRDAKNVEWRPYVCWGPGCPDYIAKDGCKPVLQLMFNLYKVEGLGIYEIDTSSKNSIININSCADYIRSIFGRVARIPLKLTIGPKEVNLPDTGKRQTIYVLNLNTDMTLLDMVNATKHFQALLPQGQRIVMPAPDEEMVPEDLAEDGEEPPEVIKEDVKVAVNSAAATSAETVITTAAPAAATVTTAGTAETTKKPTEEELNQIFMDLKSAGPRIKVHPEEIGAMINDLRKKKVAAVSREGLTDRFLNTYRVQREELAKAKTYEDMLNILCDEHLKDFIIWLTELTNKN